MVCAVRYEPVSLLFANIRVILKKNSEPTAKNVKNHCGTGISQRSANLDNREEQGARIPCNSERVVGKLGAEIQEGWRRHQVATRHWLT